jgi:hypothetical protein
MQVKTIRLGRVFKWDYESICPKLLPVNYRYYGFSEYLANIWSTYIFYHDLGLFFSHSRVVDFGTYVQLYIYFINWKAWEARVAKRSVIAYRKKNKTKVKSGFGGANVFNSYRKKLEVYPENKVNSSLARCFAFVNEKESVKKKYSSYVPVSTYRTVKDVYDLGGTLFSSKDIIYMGAEKYLARQQAMLQKMYYLRMWHRMRKHMHYVMLGQARNAPFMCGLNYLQACLDVGFRKVFVKNHIYCRRGLWGGTKNWLVLLRLYNKRIRYTKKALRVYWDTLYLRNLGVRAYSLVYINWIARMCRLFVRKIFVGLNFDWLYSASDSLLKLAGEFFFRRPIQIKYIDLGMLNLSASILSRYVAYRLEQGVSIKEIYKVIKRTVGRLTGSIAGVKVECVGRFSRAQRAGVMKFSLGKIGRTTIDGAVSYSFSKAVLRFGCCGIKVWLNRRNIGMSRRTLETSGANINILSRVVKTYGKVRRS